MQNCSECSKIHYLVSLAKCIIKNCMSFIGITFLLDHNSSSKFTKHGNNLIGPTRINQPVEASSHKVKEFLSDKASNSIEVWIEPDSTETRSQSLCARRRIEGSTFIIGRRGSGISFMPVNSPDLCISQGEPYSLSKRHCMITIKNGNVYIKDLNSRFGTVINDHRFGNSINGVSVMKLRSGVHSLTLGIRSDNIKFSITVNN